MYIILIYMSEEGIEDFQGKGPGLKSTEIMKTVLNRVRRSVNGITHPSNEGDMFQAPPLSLNWAP